MNKVCTSCKEQKPLAEFYKNSKWVRKTCKICTLLQRKIVYVKNKEKRIKRREGRIAYQCGKCRLVKNIKDFNKSSFLKSNVWCATCDKEYTGKYYNSNKTARDKKAVLWRKNNKERYNTNLRKVRATRRRTDPLYKLSINLRSRLNYALKHNIKKGSAVKDLGCSLEEVKAYLESKFYPNPLTGEEMTWKNHSMKGWHIDHIIPFAKVDLTKREDLLKVCHYTNLRPLWAFENLSKGGRYG